MRTRQEIGLDRKRSNAISWLLSLVSHRFDRILEESDDDALRWLPRLRDVVERKFWKGMQRDLESTPLDRGSIARHPRLWLDTANPLHQQLPFPAPALVWKPRNSQHQMNVLLHIPFIV